MRFVSASKQLLVDVLSLPTASFHEQKVMGYVARFCLKNKFMLRQDRAGNIFIRYKKGKAKQPVVFTAHMDHPGFEVLRAKSGWAMVGIMGGVRPDYFKKARVIISTPDGLVRGRVRGETREKWMGKKVFKVKVSARVSRGDFGYYDLPAVRFKKGMIYTKAADNLVSVAILLDLIRRLKNSGTTADVCVVLTRAEEVGFVGCMDMIESGSISRRTPVIVMETSDAKAGKVAINGGPVIRVGDKQSGFAPALDIWLQAAASVAAKEVKGFKYQRALLAGGRCEASPYMLAGYTAGGIAFPLGNYHNNGPMKYEPEYIGMNDYVNMLEFLFHLSRAPTIARAFKNKKKELWDNYGKWRKKL